MTEYIVHLNLSHATPSLPEEFYFHDVEKIDNGTTFNFVDEETKLNCIRSIKIYREGEEGHQHTYLASTLKPEK